MSGEHSIQSRGAATARRLSGLYLQCAAWYLLPVTVLWVLGVEAIYHHPTPFYGLLLPAFDTPAVPAAAAAVALTLYIVARRAFALSGRTLAPWAGLLWAIAGVALGARLLSADGAGAVLVEWWRSLRRHLVPAVVFTAAALGFRLALRRFDWFGGALERRSLALFLLGATLFAAVFPAALATVREGPAGISAPYERHQHEYIGDIGKGVTIRGLFRDYNRIHPHLSMHSKVHPPGPVALLWIVSLVTFSREPLVLSLATILIGASATIPLYFWARDLAGDRAARTCCALYALMPTVALFTATSADILFMPFTLTTLLLFHRAIARRSIAYAAGAGLMYAAMSLLSFSLIAVGAFFGFFGLWRLRGRETRMAVFQTAAVMLAAFVGTHLAVRWWSGFDVIECFRLSKAQFDTDQANLDLVTPRFAAWTWRLLNPACWFYFAGIPVSVLFVWRLCRPEPETRPLFIVFALTLLALNLLYLARGEGERSAMYIMPFVALPAAHLLDRLGAEAQSLKPLGATCVFLAVQCWLTESVLYMYW